MCLILLAVDAHPDYSLIVAANRDEACRPAAAAAFWSDAPDIYGGRDLEQGGTWLALSQRGRFAAITNYRAGDRSVTARSRGELTRDFLAGSEEIPSYLDRVTRRAHEYNGFSLIVGEPAALYFMSNRGGATQHISSGVHGLSNHLLDEPWPKVKQGKAALVSVLSSPEHEIVRTLQSALADRTRAADDALPSTGVGIERERDLSPSFIAAETYGTRASTILLVSRDGEVVFRERTFGAHGTSLGDSEHRFTLQEPSTARRAARA